MALADVLRGIRMFRAPKIAIPVLGLIENMAWFTPAELPDNRYYIFGRSGAENLARTEGVDFLGPVPLIQSVMEGSDEGRTASGNSQAAEQYFRDIAQKIVHKLEAKC